MAVSSLQWEPKRGSLKPAGKCQESATFLQRSFFNVAMQFVFVAAQLLKSECCRATSAAQPPQLSENCSATSVFACGMLQGWGLVGWGLGLADRHSQNWNLSQKSLLDAPNESNAITPPL